MFALLPISALANVGIVEPLLISKDAPVRVKFPGSAMYVELVGIHSLPAGSEIAADTPAPFRILCPDLTTLDVAPGATFACPKAQEIQLVVEVNRKRRIPIPTQSRPGCQLSGDHPLTEVQEDELAQAERQIRQANLDRELQTLLLVGLHVSFKTYARAIRDFESELRTANSPEALRRLGDLYDFGGDACNAATAYRQALERAQERRDLLGEAIAREWFAKSFYAKGEREQARKHAEQAIAFYQQLGLAEEAGDLQPLIE